jgi:CBS domain-containing protein
MGNRRTKSLAEGKLDRGPKKQSSHIPDQVGDIMDIASEDVISIHSSNSIINAAELMRDNDVRRLPVIDAGTKRLLGLVTAVDILDFLGGGSKFNIIDRDFSGNFLSAINCPISKIMRESQFLTVEDKVEAAYDIVLNKRTSCIPIVLDEDSMQLKAVISERDLMPKQGMDNLGQRVSLVMNTKPYTTTPGTVLSDIAKVMVRNQIRRLPVIAEDEIKGIVTVFDLLGYLSEGKFRGVNAQENLSVQARTLMNEDVIILKPEHDLSEAVKIVEKTGIGGFPVADEGRLVGIITMTDILRWVQKSG